MPKCEATTLFIYLQPTTSYSFKNVYFESDSIAKINVVLNDIS